MDERDVTDAFGRLLDDRPPLPPRLGRIDLVGTGRRALRRRRMVWAGAGTALAAAALTAGTVVAPALLSARPAGGPVIAGGPPAGSAAPDHRRATSAPATPRPATPQTVVPPSAVPVPGPPLADAEQCAPLAKVAYPPGAPAAGAPLPSAASIVAAVRATVLRFAPGARVTFVHAWDEAVAARTKQPRVAVWFDVVDRAGRGGMGVEVVPFRGVPARQLAEFFQQTRPYSNCTLAVLRTEPDGSAGLIYPRPLGQYKRFPDAVDGRASYLSSQGVQVDVTTVPYPYSTRWAQEQQGGSASPRAVRTTLPLTPQQAYEFARLVGSLPAGG